MNLIIDIGNTRIKAALVQQNEIKHFFVFETEHNLKDAIAALHAADLFGKFPVKNCIVSSVVDKIEPFINQLKKKTKTIVFTNKTPIPLINLYRSAHTLGPDRLAAAIGGNSVFPGKNVLVIDAGTCIKYNFVTNNNEYIGGAISPGLQMRFKALHTFTSRLPLLSLDETFDTLTGRNSNESILSGVEIGTLAEIEGFIGMYKELYPDLHIMLTGGDVYFFEKRLKSRIFADSLLILKGLNSILEHNLKISGFKNS